MVAAADLRRLYLTDLDSAAQVHAVPGSAHQWTERLVSAHLRGVLRMSILMGGKLMLTDTQLLDGRVFAALGPSGFGRLISAHASSRGWPLEIFARGPDLQSSLRGLLVAEDQPDAPLNRLFFSCLEAPYAGRVATELGNHAVSELDEYISRHGAAGGLAAMLEKCGANGADCDALARVWQSWVDAQSSFVVTQYVVSPAFEAPPGQQRLERAYTALDRCGVGREGRAALDRLLDPAAHITSRSAAYQLLDEVALQGPADARAATILRRWVDAWYHRFRADSIGADVLESRSRQALSDDAGQIRDDRHVLTLDAEFARDLGEMPPEVFATLQFQTRHHTTAWWADDRSARRRAQRRLAFAIAEQTETADLTRLWRSVAGKALVLVLAVIVVELKAQGIWRTLVVVVAACLTALPEVYEARSLLPGRLDRMLNLTSPT